MVSLCVFALLLALTAFFQIRSGAYESDFGGHSDEAAHVVTGLMVRDYLAGPVWRGTHPMRYAEGYYERFPKVAIGHYPPGYYLIEALWLLPSRTATAALTLPAFLTALAGWIVFLAGRRLVGFPAALAAAALFPLMHLVQTYTAIVMSDMLLVIWCLLAALAFARFLSSGEAKWSLAFGFLAAAAILTKGSGLLLALVPPVSIVLTGRLRMLFAPRLWLAPLPVLFFAVPWLIMTAGITSEGMAAAPVGAYSLQAVPYYFVNMFGVLGFALIALAGVAAVWTVKRARQGNAPNPTEAVMWALAVAVPVFYSAVPSGLDERYLLPVIPPVLILVFMALDRIAEAVRAKFPALPAGAVIAVFALAIGWETYTPAVKVFRGSTQAVSGLLQASEGPLRLLICSDSNGEGAVVAAAALLGPDRIAVHRGSKLLSTSDWLGRGYVANFSTDGEMLKLLRDAEITHVITDEGVPEAAVWPHQTAIAEGIRNLPDAFPGVTEVPARRRNLRSHLTIAEFAH